MKHCFIHTRIDPTVKSRAKVILDGMGIRLSQAVRLLLTQIIQTRGIPFPLVGMPTASGVETTGDLDEENRLSPQALEIERKTGEWVREQYRLEAEMKTEKIKCCVDRIE